MGGYGFVPGGTASLADIVNGLGQQKGEAATAQAQPALVQAQTATQQQVAQQEQLKNQIAQRDLRDQAIMQRAIVNNPGGDLNSITQYAVKNGISAPGYLGFQQHIADMRQKLATATKDEVANQLTAHGRVGEILQAIDQAPDNQRAQLIASSMPELQQIEPDHQWDPQQLEDPNQRKFLMGTHGMTGTLLAQAKTQAETEQAKASTGASNAAAALSGAQKAKAEAETPGVTAESTIKTRQAAAMTSMTPESVAAQVGAAIDQAKYPEEYKRTVAQAQSALQSGLGMNAVQGVIKDGADRIGRLESAVAQAKATQPIKIQTALATQNAGANAAQAGGGLDLMAEQALNGQFSSRNPVLMAKVYGRAAELAKERGFTAQGAIMEKNAAQANKGAFDALTKQYETLKPFAEMAEKNANILEAKSQLVSDLGGPFWNTPVRDLQTKFSGNTQVAAFRAALMPVQADFARILNSPTGNGVLSDDARHEMQQAVSPGATPGMIKAALDVFRQDARNRKESYEANLADLKGRSVFGGNGGAATPPTAGTVQVKDPRGVVHKFPNQAAADAFKKAAGIQ